MSEPGTTKEAALDGDKVIAFGRAVEALGKMFMEINILDIRGAFTVRSKFDSVEAILEQQKTWEMAFAAIARDIKKTADIIDANKEELERLIQLVKSTKSPDFKEGLASLHLLVELCSEIERLKESGMLEIISKLSKQ